jgi:hypothetical protein
MHGITKPAEEEENYFDAEEIDDTDVRFEMKEETVEDEL